ncbi:MAG: DRTGG domain-containing protein [Dehalococcoidia bacterium]
MNALYVTSDRPGAGKTALCSALAGWLQGQGKRVALLKPVVMDPGDGSQTAEDADLRFYRETVLQRNGKATAGALTLTPRRLADPAILAAPESQRRVQEAFQQLARDADMVIVEGPSLTTPQGEPTFGGAEVVNQAEMLGCGVVVVRHAPAGLTVEEASRLAESFGEAFRGLLINSVTRYQGHTTRLELAPQIEAAGVRVLGMVPEDRRLLAVTLGQLAEHLQAEWLLGQEQVERLVEHFMIGGFMMDEATLYFGQRENKAVLVRADKPDLQFAALQGSCACLLLTGAQAQMDYEYPIQYVRHEALRQGVPMLAVKKDTLSTATALETVLERATFHHPQKLERFQELLARQGTLEALQEVLG